MLCSEIFAAPVRLFEADYIDLPTTTVVVNPVPSDIARLLTKESTLRALSEPGRLVVWPAEEALHQPVQIALKMDERARRYLIFSSTQPNPRAVSRVGRFFVWLMDSANAFIQPDLMGSSIKRALAVR